MIEVWIDVEGIL